MNTDILVPLLVCGLLGLALYALHALFIGFIFAKAGEARWKAWVPVYGSWTFFRLAGMSGRWAIAELIPIVNIGAWIAKLAAAYIIGIRLGKRPVWVVLFALLPLVWIIINAVDRSEWSEELEPADDDYQWRQAFNDIFSGNALMTFLAIGLALLVSSVLIVLVDKDVHATVGYFLARPLDTIGAIWDSISGAFVSLFQGSVYNFRRPSFADGIRPLTETLTFATPLILAGLGVALSFRAGLFNIGAKGQMLMAAGAAGYVAFAWPMPYGIHLIVAVAAGFLAAAIWGGIVGLLKATTGAHEVIVTIMLNYVAFYFIAWLLRTPGALQAPGSNNPKSPAMLPTAVFPEILGPKYNLHLGFILAIAATIAVYFLINRSSMGFQFRAVGINPNAAKVAGMNVGANYVWVMVLAGGLAGLAGVAQVLGTVTTGFTEGIDAGIGFDAITVALLGRSRPIGVFFAGVLFGALKAGGYSMQAAEQIPIDIVLVVQSAIVLFIAAPPLVRMIFRLPRAMERRDTRLSAKLNGKKAVVTR